MTDYHQVDTASVKPQPLLETPVVNFRYTGLQVLSFDWVSPIWGDPKWGGKQQNAVFHFTVDGMLPRTQYVELRIVGQPNCTASKQPSSTSTALTARALSQCGDLGFVAARSYIVYRQVV